MFSNERMNLLQDYGDTFAATEQQLFLSTLSKFQN